MIDSAELFFYKKIIHAITLHNHFHLLIFLLFFIQGRTWSQIMCLTLRYFYFHNMIVLAILDCLILVNIFFYFTLSLYHSITLSPSLSHSLSLSFSLFLSLSLSLSFSLSLPLTISLSLSVSPPLSQSFSLSFSHFLFLSFRLVSRN